MRTIAAYTADRGGGAGSRGDAVQNTAAFSVFREGLRFYWFSSALGAGRLLPRMDLWRYVEYPLVYRSLDLRDGQRVLDIGSGRSIFPLYLAAERRYHVRITDNEAYHPTALRFQRTKLEKRLRLSGDVRDGRIVVERQDACRLQYGDASFDRVTCISVLGNLPADGDREAIAEIGRVLRPGGRAAVTVPYAERYVERPCAPWVEYFERRYDGAALSERLVRPSGLREVARVFFGEGALRASRLYHRDVPGPLRLVVQMLTPVLSALCMRTGSAPCRTGGAMLVLAKPPSGGL